MVLPPLSTTPEWVAAWRSLLYVLNHRRDVLRRALGGLVLVAPPAVKPIAQRQASDLWSVLDLLIELGRQPVLTAPPDAGSIPVGEPAERDLGISGLSLGAPSDAQTDEAAVLLALPPEQLAGTARDRATDAIRAARSAGQNQLAAVLLLRQADGYRRTGDHAAALNLVRNALLLDGVDETTTIRLLDEAVELALVNVELAEAAGYAQRSVDLKEQRAAAAGTPESLRDLSVSLNKLGDVDWARGDLDAASGRYARGLELAERLAALLGTPGALRDLAFSLERLAAVEAERGEADRAETLLRRAAEIDATLDRLPGSSGPRSAASDGL
ncbi:MAG TPA: hypothetical protein VFM37_05190 [Pseudonocardiaceae bacterium]|nr:hypothetical protein [Pseudonocardiaceae bacterium]